MDDSWFEEILGRLDAVEQAMRSCESEVVEHVEELLRRYCRPFAWSSSSVSSSASWS